MRQEHAAPGGLHVPEHCPISILQAHGGGAIPEVALWTTERFVRFLSTLAVDHPKHNVPAAPPRRPADAWLCLSGLCPLPGILVSAMLRRTSPFTR